MHPAAAGGLRLQSAQLLVPWERRKKGGPVPFFLKKKENKMEEVWRAVYEELGDSPRVAAGFKRIF